MMTSPSPEEGEHMEEDEDADDDSQLYVVEDTLEPMGASAHEVAGVPSSQSEAAVIGRHRREPGGSREDLRSHHSREDQEETRAKVILHDGSSQADRESNDERYYEDEARDADEAHQRRDGRESG